MTQSRRVLKDISFYSASILLTQAITVAASVVTRRFLGPTQMGVWAFLQTVLSYAEYSSLGTTSAASMEIPRLNGRGEAEQSRRVADAAFSFALISSLTISICTAVYAILAKNAMPQELFYGFLMAGAFVVLQRFNGLLISLVRANKQFVLAGQQMLYSSIVNAVLIALLSYRYKIYGFLAAMALSLFFNIVYLAYRAGLKMKFVLDWKQMAALVRYGFPLMTVGFLTTAFETMDRLFITRFLGFEALGLYSVALMAVNYLNGVPNSVGIVTISHLQERHGATGDKEDLRNYVRKVDSGYGTLMAILIGISWFLVPMLVRLALPEFVRGLDALRWLVLGTYFSAVGQGYLQLVYVIRKHRTLLILLPISCAFAAAANGLALFLKLGVPGIAVATAFSMFVYYTLLFFYGSLQVEGWGGAAKRYARNFGFFALILALTLGTDRLIPLPVSVLGSCVKTAVYLLLLSPFLWRLNREFGLTSFWPFKLFAKRAA